MEEVYRDTIADKGHEVKEKMLQLSESFMGVMATTPHGNVFKGQQVFLWDFEEESVRFSFVKVDISRSKESWVLNPPL